VHKNELRRWTESHARGKVSSTPHAHAEPEPATDEEEQRREKTERSSKGGKTGWRRIRELWPLSGEGAAAAAIPCHFSAASSAGQRGSSGRTAGSGGGGAAARRGWDRGGAREPKKFCRKGFPGAEGGDLNKRHSWEAAEQCNKFDALGVDLLRLGPSTGCTKRSLGSLREELNKGPAKFFKRYGGPCDVQVSVYYLVQGILRAGWLGSWYWLVCHSDCFRLLFVSVLGTRELF
jgi:hypothetical protein